MKKPKRVLVIYKKSIYEIYFAKRAQNPFLRKKKIPSNLIQTFQKSHYIHYSTLKGVQDVLDGLQIPFCTIDRKREANFSLFDLVITVGGDGTFLNAASRIKSQIVVGVNSNPQVSVGRFCSANLSNFEQIFKLFLSGKSQVKHLARMNVRLNTQKNEVYTVLNDLLICHRNPCAMSHYVIRVNKNKEYQRSSGVWIATAAGSTGAIQSAGGTPMPLSSKYIQYKPRELYEYKDGLYKCRGSVVRSNKTIQIDSKMEEGMVYLDGTRLGFPFCHGESLLITRSAYPLKVLDYKSYLKASHLKRRR